ncbi:MAG: IS110 family transposase [Pseudomonadota bacterium]
MNTPFDHFIGVDPAADSFTASLYNHPTAHTFDNTTDGRARFRHWIEQTTAETHSTLVVVENTGVYSEALAYELHAHGHPMAMVEPFKVWKAFGTSAPKTDALDSQKIAEYGARYADTLTLWQPCPAIVEQVRVLLNTREQFVEQKTALLNMQKALARKVVQTPLADDALSASIGQLKHQIKRLEREVRKLIESNPRTGQMLALLVTAPGVRLLLAAQLYVLTKGYTEVPGYRRLANYLGIAPHRYESGTSVRRGSRSRGGGPPAVRKLLHLAARSVCVHNASYRAYAESKQRSGKPSGLIYNNVANKLLRVLCSMLLHERAYDASYRSVQPRLLKASEA